MDTRVDDLLAQRRIGDRFLVLGIELRDDIFRRRGRCDEALFLVEALVDGEGRRVAQQDRVAVLVMRSSLSRWTLRIRLVG
jgi:hypothetical protein